MYCWTFLKHPCWTPLQRSLGFPYFSHLKFCNDRKNKVKIWTSRPRVTAHYWVTLNKYSLCKIPHLSTFNHTHVIKFFPFKTAKPEETDNMGKHSDSRRIPHRAAHMWSVKSKYWPLIAEKNSCQDKLTSFLNNMNVAWLAISALRVKIYQRYDIMSKLCFFHTCIMYIYFLHNMESSQCQNSMSNQIGFDFKEFFVPFKHPSGFIA